MKGDGKNLYLLISHESALSYWRVAGHRALGTATARRSATQSARAVLDANQKPVYAGSLRPGGCRFPLRVLVGDDVARTRTQSLVSRTWGGALPDASFVDAGQEFLISTPEACFLQLASELSLLELIKVGFELCGTYALDEMGSSFVSRAEALTTVSALRRYIERARYARGHKRAKRAVRYVLDGSASPMETAVVMMLCLPYALGGYKVPVPTLNQRIELSKQAKVLAGRGFCVADMCWQQAKLVVEYDSDAHHTGADRIARDSQKRSALIAMGYHVMSITRPQVMDGGAFNQLAIELAKLVGKRVQYKDPQFTRKHQELRSALFGNAGSR